MARLADRWNFNGKTVEEFVRLNRVLDQHCHSVGRDPATIERSVQRHMTEDFDAEADLIAGYVTAGAQHVVPNPRITLFPGIAAQATQHIIEPILRGG